MKTKPLFLCLGFALICAAANLSAQDFSLSRTFISPTDPQESLLSLKARARLSLRVASSAGLGLSIVDKMEGQLAQDGRPGGRDGRIDISLERGDYKLYLQGSDSAGKKVGIQALGFKEIAGARPEAWPYIHDGQTQTLALEDLQSYSAWVYQGSDGPFELEALGRNLAEVELWKEGQYRLELSPTKEVYSPEPGRPMGYFCFSAQLEKGLYLVKFYGGPERDWAKGEAGKSLHIRRGIPVLEAGALKRHSLSPFGRDYYLADYARELLVRQDERLDINATSLSYKLGQGRSNAQSSVSISKKSKDSYAFLELIGSPSLVCLRAQPGLVLQLQSFQNFISESLSPEQLRQGGLIRLFSPESGEAGLDLSPMIYRLVTEKGKRRPEIVKENLPVVGSESPIRQRANLLTDAYQALSLFIRVDDAGSYRIAERKGGARALYRITPFESAMEGGGKQALAADKAVFSLTKGYHVLEIRSERLGVLDFALYKEGSLGAAKAATDSLEKDPPSRQASLEYRVVAGAEKETLYLISNSRTPSRNAMTFLPGGPAAAENKAAALPKPAISEFGSGLTRLSPEQAVFKNFERNQTEVYYFSLSQDSIYRVESLGRLATALNLRTALRSSLFKAKENGYGRNALIQGYLRAGDYLVELQSQGNSKGRAGIRLVKLDIPPAIAMAPGSIDRRSLAADAALLYSLEIGKADGYEAASMGLGGYFPLRLEDADGFPLYTGSAQARANLGPGRYALYSLPANVDTRRLTYLKATTSVTQEGALDAKGARTFALNANLSARWMDKEGPDLYRFSLAAAVVASFSLPGGFEASLSGPGGAVNLDIAQRGVISLGAGDYLLALKPKEKNNNLPYSLGLSTSFLVPGLSQSLSVGPKPVSVDVSVSQEGFYELWSFGMNDIAARLYREGESIALAMGDDRDADWNFSILQSMKSGRYRLELRSLSGRERAVELMLDQRNPRALPAALSSYASSQCLDSQGILLPFSNKEAEGIFEVSALTTSPQAGLPVELRLYSDGQLIASGRNSIYIPLKKGSFYSLLAWADLPLIAALSVKRLREKTLSLTADTKLEAAAAYKITSPGGLSGRALSGSLLVSPALDMACLPAGGSAFPAEAGIIWAYTDKGEARIGPLSLSAGSGESLGFGRGSQALMVEASEDARLLSAVNQGAFRAGLEAIADTETFTSVYDWSSSLPYSQGSLSLLPPGAWKVRAWDAQAERAGAGQLGLGLTSYPIEKRFSLGLGKNETLEISAGKAILIDLPASSPSLLLAKGLVASVWKGKIAQATIHSLDSRRAELLSLPASTLCVANTGIESASLRVFVAPAKDKGAQDMAALSPGKAFEALDLGSQSVSIPIKPGNPGQLLCLAGESLSAEFLGEDGRFERLDHSSQSALYSSMSAANGVLVLRSSGAWARAWLAAPGKEEESLVEQEGQATRDLKSGALALSGKAESFKLTMDGSGYVDLSCYGPALISLSRNAKIIKSVLSGGRGELHLLAYLQAGEYRVFVRPPRGRALAEIFQASKVEARAVAALSAGQKSFIGAREYQAYSFSVAQDSMVGAGIRADSDGMEAFLYDSSQNLLGNGPVIFRKLKAGDYILVLRGPDRLPMEYELLLLGIDGSRQGVPRDILDSYKSKAGSAPPGDQNYGSVEYPDDEYYEEAGYDEEGYEEGYSEDGYEGEGYEGEGYEDEGENYDGK